ncbi:MAG: NAD(P)-dependent oxidoreductase [Candidatus Riflebacteria bacterium]|nr:NAD(P)-dependent oxidoreductase [Candidatus Riflebacteria bacterium]
MNILFTGCSSYIAKYVITRLLRDGEIILGVSRTNPNIIHGNFSWISHDLSISPYFPERNIDIIIHMAGQSLLNKSAEEYLKSNILVTENVVKIARKLAPRLIIYTSSIKVYGTVRVSEVTENTDIINPGLYGLTKYFCENILQENIQTISLRMPGVIGVGSHGWIDGVYKTLKKSASLSISNMLYNHLIHVRDIYGFIRHIFDEQYDTSDSFIICADELTTSLEVVELMRKELYSNSLIDCQEKDNENKYVLSNKKLLTKYRPLTVKASIYLYLQEMSLGFDKYSHGKLEAAEKTVLA